MCWAARRLTFSFECDIDILQHLHRVRAATLLLCIEENVALLGNRAVDHIEEDGAEALLHVRTNPDQEPVVELHGSGQDSTDTGTRANGNTATEEVS